MNWFLIVPIIILIIVLSLDFYIYKCLRRFSFAQKYETQKKKHIAITIVPVALLNLGFLFDFMVSLIIIAYIALSFLIFNIINYIVKIIRKKEIKKYYAGIIALVVALSFIIYGLINANNIVKTEYNIKTTKEISGLKIAQITDIHLGTTFDGKTFSKHIN